MRTCPPCLIWTWIWMMTSSRRPLQAGQDRKMSRRDPLPGLPPFHMFAVLCIRQLGRRLLNQCTIRQCDWGKRSGGGGGGVGIGL